MMDHLEAQDLFSAYQDNDLSLAQKAELEAHLSACPSCAEEWQLFQTALSGVSGLIRIAPPVDVVGRVKQKIRRRSAGRFFGVQKGSDMQFAIVSFTLILAFMLAYLLLQAVSEISIVEGLHGGDVDTLDTAE